MATINQEYSLSSGASIPGSVQRNTGGATPTNIAPGITGGASNAMANNAVNGFDPSGYYGAITSNIRAAQEARIGSLRSQEAGQIQGERDFEQKSQDFARATLGKIGGFEGSYQISLQNSIANRAENNIKAIKRATEEAINTGDMEMQSKLADLGFQQMKLLVDLNQQQFERTRALNAETMDMARLKLAQDQAALQGREFKQLDNGDYGYWDATTNKFIKLGNAAKPKSASSLGIDNVFGKKIKERTPLFDRVKDEYVGDEIVFADGTKQFVDPSGTRLLSTDPKMVRGGMSTATGESQPVYGAPELDLTKIKRGNPQTQSLAQQLFSVGAINPLVLDEN